MVEQEGRDPGRKPVAKLEKQAPVQNWLQSWSPSYRAWSIRDDNVPWGYSGGWGLAKMESGIGMSVGGGDELSRWWANRD